MTYVPGDHWKICDVCGFKYRASQTMRRWDNLLVCREDYEPRHPQDFVRGVADRQNVPNPRPEPAHIFIGTGEQILTELGEALWSEDGSYLMTES